MKLPTLTRTPMGYSRTLPADVGGGGERFGPPAICQTNGPILDPKTAFDSSGFEISEKIAQFYLNGTDGVTGRVKVQVFGYLPLLASPGKAAVSNRNKAVGTTLIVYGILLSTVLSFLWSSVKSR